MDTFAQSLLGQIERATGQAAPWGDINPLVVIGLTEAILDLGLTEDQIYPVVRSFTRQLAAQVHPDRNPVNVSLDRQQQILAALNYLDDRENFTRALKDFRNLKAEDRRENKVLSQTVSVLRQQVADFEGQAESVRTGREQLEQEKTVFDQRKREDELLAPTLQLENQRLLESVKRLRRLTDSTIPTFRFEELQARTERLEKSRDRARYRASDWRQRFESVASYVIGYGIRASSQGLLVSDASWMAVASLWPSSDAHPWLGSEEGTKRFQAAAVEMGISESRISNILTDWNAVLKRFEGPYLDQRGGEQFMWLSLLKLQVGAPKFVCGHPSAAINGRRLVGSIHPNRLSITTEHFYRVVDQLEMLSKINPVLTPGGLAVTISGINNRDRASWSIGCPAFRTDTKRYIIAVG